MSKPTSLQYGKYYHIYNRGNNREDIFFKVRNYRYFLQLYAKYIEPVADTFTYSLLRNHFHFLVRTKTVEEQEKTLQTLGVSEAPRVFTPAHPSQQLGNLFNAPQRRSTRPTIAPEVSFKTPSVVSKSHPMFTLCGS